MPAIKVASGSNLILRDTRIENFDVGVEADPSGSVDAKNTTFNNVRQPWKVAGPGSSRVSGTRIRNDPKVGEGTNRSSVGWRGDRGPPLPAFCPNCKSVFPSRNYNFGNSRFYSRDNEETCLLCGFEHAKLSDGLFDLGEKVVRVLSAPDFTHAMLAAVAAVLDQASREGMSPEAAISKLGSIHPKIGKLAKRAAKYGNTAIAFLVSVAALAATYMTYEQLKLSQEQTAIAREQLVLQRQAGSSSDEIMQKVLEALAQHRFVSEKTVEQQKPGQISKPKSKRDVKASRRGKSKRAR